MSNEKHTEMAASDDAYVTLLAVHARIAAVPAGKTLIEVISDEEWGQDEQADWMINAGSDECGNSEELDNSDDITVSAA